MDRRNFLSTTAAGLAGATLAPTSAAASPQVNPELESCLSLISSERSEVTELEGEEVRPTLLWRVVFRTTEAHTEVMRHYRVMEREHSSNTITGRFDLEIDGRHQASQHVFSPDDFVIRPAYHESIAARAAKVPRHHWLCWITVECSDGRRCHFTKWFPEISNEFFRVKIGKVYDLAQVP